MDKFSDIILKAKSISQKQQKGYRIYTDKTNFTLVEADTAALAMEQSGIKNPYKIEACNLVSKSVFSKEELIDTL